MAGVGIATAVTVAATVASTAAGVASQAGAFGGGSSGGGSSAKPNFKPVPRSPDDQAMRDYYSRMLIMNANAQPPSFADYSNSGGDPSKAQFPLQMPGLTPKEMTALGFTGPQGQAVPTTSQADVAAGGTSGMQLTPAQEVFLGKQRSREAQQAGGPGNATPLQRLGQVSTRLENVQQRLTGMGTTDLPAGPGPAGSQGRIQDRLEARVTKLQQRQQNLQQKVGQM
jgi:hypothetical protein